jgi:hypothetical protein
VQTTDGVDPDVYYTRHASRYMSEDERKGSLGESDANRDDERSRERYGKGRGRRAVVMQARWPLENLDLGVCLRRYLWSGME